MAWNSLTVRKKTNMPLRWIFIFVLLLTAVYSPLVLSSEVQLKFEAPANTLFYINDSYIPTTYSKGNHITKLAVNRTFPFILKARGPLGGWMEFSINKPSDLLKIHIPESIIKDKDTHPQTLKSLPKICPRVSLEVVGRQQQNNEPLFKATYHAKKDTLNQVPLFQLLDDDFLTKDQYKSYSEMDGKNVLLLKRVTLKNDYEDNRILDYEGPHPLTQKNIRTYEGDGGFYANLHYAVVPFNSKYTRLGRQEILHLAQGSLKKIHLSRYQPILRTHSFIPGPFLSKDPTVYDLCEWGDTTYQAPIQTMYYKDMALWDWDYSIKNGDDILLILWEGDEEATQLNNHLIPSNYLTDDLIGLFHIRREDTLKPLLLQNETKDISLTVTTGQIHIETPLIFSPK